jgi:cation diffusion facilitator CzcD-associated flavoprotein CzcO
MNTSQHTSQTTVAIIGTGFGGLCMAIQLKKAGIDSFIIFEKTDQIGGTWRDNTYPGAACDVPSHLYSFSFEPKHDWTRKYSEQKEIFEYLQHCAKKYKILPHIHFNTEIESVTFDEQAGMWHFSSTKGEQFSSKIFVSACGQLNRPAYPKIPGLEDFQGVQFHSARWNHKYDLTDKRVAVIGTGASAIQFVPQVAKKAKELILFQRTPAWIVSKPDRAYLPIEKTLFKHIPFLRTLHRGQIYWWNEIRFLSFQQNNIANKIFQWAAQRHLEQNIKDPKLKELLTPDYPLGCKRILISNDYLASLTKPNVNIVTDNILEVEADGITSSKGKFYPVDAIIYGTGFQSTDFLAPMKITGRSGQDLNQAWKDGAEAYLGITVTGFPNLFILYGPNTNLGHNSIIYMIEAQVKYIISCINTLKEKNLRFLDVKNEPQSVYNNEIQKRMKTSVWAAGCTNWYINASGKNTNNWPSFTFEYYWRTYKVNLSDYELVSNNGNTR